jgi:AcrR family transcriptional regulator
MALRKKTPAGKNVAARTTRSGRKFGTRSVPRETRMEEMLQVAARVFAARGYHGTSMDDIASQADISKPLLYRYFGSKDGLYIALIERAGEHLLAGMGLISHEGDPLARVERGVNAILTFIDRYRDFWRVLFSEGLIASPPVAEHVMKLRNRMIAHSNRTFAQIVGDPSEAGCRAVEPLTYALYGAGESIARWWLAHPETPVATLRQLMLGMLIPALASMRNRHAPVAATQGDRSRSQAARSPAAASSTASADS